MKSFGNTLLTILCAVLWAGCGRLPSGSVSNDGSDAPEEVLFQISDVRMAEEYKMAPRCKMFVFGKGFLKGDSLRIVSQSEGIGPVDMVLPSAAFSDMILGIVPEGLPDDSYELFIKRGRGLFSLGSATLLFDEGYRPRPWGLVPHRGDTEQGAPDNSIEALRRAIDAGVFGTEFDVRLSGDDIPIVCHEAKMDTYEPELESIPYSEIAQRYHFHNGETINTLDAFLTAVGKDRHTRLFMDIKQQSTKEKTLHLTDLALAAIKKFGLEYITDYMSVDFDVCMKIAATKPHGLVGYLAWMQDELDAIRAGTTFLPMARSHFIEDPERFARYKASVVPLNPGADTPEEFEWVLENGIDIIGTDHLSVGLKYIHHRFVEY